MEFKRPEGVVYPQIYKNFQVKSPDSDEIEEFIIQDLTEEFFDVAVDFIVENHAKGAVYHRAAGTLADESGLQKVRKNYRNAFEEKISLICLKKDTREVVGLNGLCIKTRDNLISPVVCSL